MFPHNFCPIGFFETKIFKDFPLYIYSHVKNVTPLSCSSTFPLGSSIWTILHIQYLRMPPHKLILLRPNDFWKRRRYLKIFFISSYVKFDPNCDPSYPCGSWFDLHYLRMLHTSSAFLVDWFFQKIKKKYSKFTKILY